MNLNELWFVLISVLFCGFFFLEGFDFGVGMLVPVLGKTDLERRTLINTIGPVWDANEVWLITAGGAIFAAFPGWYATMFSGLYLALFFVLAALIIRGVAFEFRSKVENKTWRSSWDVCIGIGSFLPPLLLGVAMANLIKGLPINAELEYAGSLLDLLSVPALIVGATAVVLFLYHGAVYLSLKLEGPVLERVYNAGRRAGVASILMALASGIAAAYATEIFRKPLSGVLAVLAFAAIAASYLMFLKKRTARAMALNCLSIVGAVASLFSALFPRVMVSSIKEEFSLTIYNVSSSPYTLKIMSIITLTILPVVLGYFIWTYWVFRKRVTVKHLEY